MCLHHVLISHDSPVKSPGMPPLGSCRTVWLVGWVLAKSSDGPGNSAELGRFFVKSGPGFHRVSSGGVWVLFLGGIQSLLQGLFGNFDVFSL